MDKFLKNANCRMTFVLDNYSFFLFRFWLGITVNWHIRIETYALCNLNFEKKKEKYLPEILIKVLKYQYKNCSFDAKVYFETEC